MGGRERRLAYGLIPHDSRNFPLSDSMMKSDQGASKGKMPDHIQDDFETQAAAADEWKRRNWYYHKSVVDLVRFFVPEGRSILEVGSGTGDLLAALKPSRGVGIDFSDEMLQIAGVYPVCFCRPRYSVIPKEAGQPKNSSRSLSA